MKIIAIVGPTAVGKTALAIKLAKELDGEIISCDSMQIYKGMDIGTAKPTKEEILNAWKEFKGKPQELGLPNAPEQFITYFEEDNRPQAALDRDIYGGMGVTVGRLREDIIYDYKFVGLSHNTLRGAAGGAVLLAELLAAKGYFD